jgi:hypothetical protein
MDPRNFLRKCASEITFCVLKCFYSCRNDCRSYFATSPILSAFVITNLFSANRIIELGLLWSSFYREVTYLRSHSYLIVFIFEHRLLALESVLILSLWCATAPCLKSSLFTCSESKVTGENPVSLLFLYRCTFLPPIPWITLAYSLYC